MGGLRSEPRGSRGRNKELHGKSQRKEGKDGVWLFLRQTQFSREKGEIQGKEVNIHVSRLSVNVQI